MIKRTPKLYTCISSCTSNSIVNCIAVLFLFLKPFTLNVQAALDSTETVSGELKENSKKERKAELESGLPSAENERAKKRIIASEQSSNAAPETEEENEEIFIMDDFVVTTEDDVGYYSANTLAGTRTNELTKNIPMTISTINREAIEDFGMTGLEDLGKYVASIESEDDGYENKAIRFRGFVSRSQLFEFMPRYSPLGFYMVERTDVVRGANSLIYGQADPGGKVNVISKVAKFNKDETKLSASFGDKDYHKFTLDKNILIGDKGAIRVMATDEYSEYTQRYKFRDFQGLALETAYNPTKNTRLRFHVDFAKEERSVIFGTFRVGQGPTGLPSGFTADPRMANLVSNEYLQYLVNYNDGSLRGNGPQVVPNGTNIYEQYGIDSNLVLADPSQLREKKGPLVPDYITSRESIRKMFSGITPENTATAYGPDSISSKDSHFILGEIVHKFSDNLELKVALAHEDAKSASQTAGFSSNSIQHTLGYGTSVLPPNLPYGVNTTTDDLYENSRASELLETFNGLYNQEGSAQALVTLRDAIQDGIDNWRSNAGNAFNVGMDSYLNTLDPDQNTAEQIFADQLLGYYINENLDFEQLSLEGIARAHGGVMNYLNRFVGTSENKDVRVGDKVWALTGNNDGWKDAYTYSTQKSLDTYIYKEFERLYQLFNPSGSFERPHGGGSKVLWSTNKFIDINKLQERVHNLGSSALSAIFDDETLISNFIMTYEGGMTAYEGVDTNGNGRVDTGTEEETTAQRTAIANDIAARLVNKSDPDQYTASEFWDSLRSIKDLFDYHLNGEVKIGWAWTGTLFPSLVNNEQIDSITTDNTGEGGVINPSLLTNSNGISVPYIRSLWERSYTRDNNKSARITLNYSPDKSSILGSQKFLFGLDLDRREASKTTEEQYLEGTLDYDNGVVLNDGIAAQYAMLNLILGSYVRRFDMNQDTSTLSGTTASAVAALRKMSTNPNNETKFRDTYAAKTTVDTIGLWAAASGSYFNGRLRTLLGARIDTITVDSSYTDYKIKELNGSLNSQDPIETFPNETEQSVKYNNRIKSFSGHDNDSLEMFFTPSLGGLFWLTDQLGIFGNYSRSVISPTGFQYDVFGELTPPETGEGIECGLKFSSNDGKINAQLMAFRIDKKNDQRSNLDWTQLRAIYPENIDGKPKIYDMQPVYDANGDLLYERKVFDPLGYRVANEELRSEGIEFDLNFNPFKQLTIVLGYAFLDTTILRSSLDILEGLELAGTAPHNANIYFRYSFPWDSKLRGCFISLNQKYRSAALLNNYFADLNYDGIQDYTPLVDKDQNTVLDTNGDPVVMPRYYPIYMQDQFLTDLGIGWSGKIGKSKTAPTLRIQLNISNLFDTMRLYSTGKNQSRYNESRSYRLTASMSF